MVHLAEQDTNVLQTLITGPVSLCLSVSLCLALPHSPLSPFLSASLFLSDKHSLSLHARSCLLALYLRIFY